jgi:hypothetical protein
MGRSLSIQRSAIPRTITTRIATIAAATILSRRSRWDLPAARLIWDRSPLIRSIASRITLPVRSACRTGIEGRAFSDESRKLWAVQTAQSSDFSNQDRVKNIAFCGKQRYDGRMLSNWKPRACQAEKNHSASKDYRDVARERTWEPNFSGLLRFARNDDRSSNAGATRPNCRSGVKSSARAQLSL